VGGWEDLGDAGLLVHVMDGWEDHNEAWRAPARTDCGEQPQCGHADISCSLVHAGVHSAAATTKQLIPVFNSGDSGLILRPGHAPILCGKGGDSSGHCGEWCPSASVDEALSDETIARWDQNGDGCSRSWRPPDFPAYLRRQERYQLRYQRLGHNEIVVGGDDWNGALPLLIDAMFGTKTLDLHKTFLAKYELNEVDCPHLEADWANWETPLRSSDANLVVL
jgi:hypothetical protein